MNFIFPANYSFKNKLFGFIDYSTIIFVFLWCLTIFCISNILFININFKIFFVISFCFPILIISIVGFNHENIIYVFTYLIKFLIKRKVYIFNKIY